jgi:predicted HTH transcriptional regulator
MADIITDLNTDILTKVEREFLEQIAGYVKTYGEITNYRAQLLTNRSAETVKKLLVRLVELQALEAIGENKGRRYVIRKEGAQ